MPNREGDYEITRKYRWYREEYLKTKISFSEYQKAYTAWRATRPSSPERTLGNDVENSVNALMYRGVAIPEYYSRKPVNPVVASRVMHVIELVYAIARKRSVHAVLSPRCRNRERLAVYTYTAQELAQACAVLEYSPESVYRALLNARNDQYYISIT